MNVELRILRYAPESDPAPHWVTFQVERAPMDRVLDLLIKVKAEQDGSVSFLRSCGHCICGSDALLIKVKAEQDGSVTFPRSCGHAICDSDAMLINNRNRLPCRIRVDQLGKKI